MSYHDLKSYQQSTIIYDFTIEFCKSYIDFKSRTKDQMEQAARSGKQNIVEGSQISRTSKKSELKLLGVARASLEELLEDYLDYLRQHHFSVWSMNSPQAKTVRNFAYQPYLSYPSYFAYLSSPELAANAMVCLINQTNYLLDHQIKAVEDKFVSEGGYTENLFKRRLQNRSR